MPEELTEMYKDLKKKLYITLSGDTNSKVVSEQLYHRDIVAMSSAAAVNKLNQLTSGFIIDTEAINENKLLHEGLQEVHVLSYYRFIELQKLLQTIGNEQAIIWCYYKKEFELIKELLGDKCVCVYGDVNITDKRINLKRFKSGEAQYLIANPASADKGLTLTNAHIAIYFSMGYSMELWKQSTERIYGSTRSQPHRCTYYIMMAKGTVDELIYASVQNKFNISTELLNYLKGG
jgi:superfamily II DNA/RNA helicase